MGRGWSWGCGPLLCLDPTTMGRERGICRVPIKSGRAFPVQQQDFWPHGESAWSPWSDGALEGSSVLPGPPQLNLGEEEVWPQCGSLHQVHYILPLPAHSIGAAQGLVQH